ncbi:hypothetical protein [Candidatus Poriferisodalis sp.]|uniref:hypothetical protein n=1 Tax=Candidatus Poriferisodalis sp. TaxID=3101277 RepID=UPI003B0294FB
MGAIEVSEADGSPQQRPLRNVEHQGVVDELLEEILNEQIDAPVKNDPAYTRIERFQRSTQREAVRVALRLRSPTYRHLCAQLGLLSLEWLVRIRRGLIWSAPFLGTAYITHEFATGCGPQTQPPLSDAPIQ